MRNTCERNCSKLRHSAKKRLLFLAVAILLALSVGLTIVFASPGQQNVRLHIFKHWGELLGPPVVVEEFPGDRKTALTWEDPLDADVAYYQIQIDNFDWVDFPLSSLKHDTNNAWRYYLFENLPNGTRLENNTEYTFRVRAIGTNGVPGAIFVVRSIPGPLGDIGGKNTDLLTVYYVNVMPQGGWANAPGDGTISAPYTAELELPADFSHTVINRDFIELGQDATFVMYSDPGFTNEVKVVDRIDNSFNWLPAVHIYIHATSGNTLLEAFYDITVKTP